MAIIRVMEQATTRGPFEIVDDGLNQHLTVRAVRQPVVLWVATPLTVLCMLTGLVIAVLELKKGRYSEALALFLGILLVCVVTFMTVAPFIWRPEVSVSRGQLVLRSRRKERRFSADEFDGFKWEDLPSRHHKTPAYVRLWARCKRGPPLLLLTVGANAGDDQARQQAAEFVVHCLERVMTGHRPELKGPPPRGVPSRG